MLKEKNRSQNKKHTIEIAQPEIVALLLEEKLRCGLNDILTY